MEDDSPGLVEFDRVQSVPPTPPPELEPEGLRAIDGERGPAVSLDVA